MVLDHQDLPNDAEELVAEYRRVSTELREIESNPKLIKDRESAILEAVPRLKAIEEDTYEPSPGERGIKSYWLTDYDDPGEPYGYSLELDEEYMTPPEQLATNEIEGWNSKKSDLKELLKLLRVQAATLGITLPEQEGDESKPEPSNLETTHPAISVDYLFRKKGDIWNIVFEGSSAHLKNLKGLHYIKHLLVATTEQRYAQFSPTYSARKILKVLEGGRAKKKSA